MNTSKDLLKWLTSDRFLVIFFSILDLILVIYARSYLNSINHLSSQDLSEHLMQDRSIASEVSAQEVQAIRLLQNQARTGSWDSFEKVRMEEAALFLHSETKPNAGNSLYFFPETLPEKSLEKDFVSQELIPGIKDLKQASQSNNKSHTENAYRKLKSRVENYELGPSNDSSQLSEEAKQFLNLYRELSKL